MIKRRMKKKHTVVCGGERNGCACVTNVTGMSMSVRSRSPASSECQSTAPPMPTPSPRPTHHLSARPTSELLTGSGIFQTPEGPFLFFSIPSPSSPCLQQRLSTSGSKTSRTMRPLLSVFFFLFSLSALISVQEDMAAASLDVNFKEELGAIEQCQSFSFLHFVSSYFHRVQGPLRSRAHRCPLQSSPAFYPGSDPFLHHRPPADGQGRPHDCPPQPRRRLHAEPDGSLLCPIKVSCPQIKHPPLPNSTRFRSEPPVPRSRQ